VGLFLNLTRNCRSRKVDPTASKRTGASESAATRVGGCGEEGRLEAQAWWVTPDTQTRVVQTVSKPSFS
jgi:hypothetical protein